MYWYYDTPIGRLEIRYIPIERCYAFVFNGVHWEACDSPVSEASNIFCHATGCTEWDLSDCYAPEDLAEWIRCS